jgi:hypothetical protein
MAGSQTLERLVGYSASREMSCAALSATPYLSPPSSSSTAHRWAIASSARYAAGSTVALVRIWLGAFQGNRLEGRLYPTLSMRGTQPEQEYHTRSRDHE